MKPPRNATKTNATKIKAAQINVTRIKAAFQIVCGLCATALLFHAQSEPAAPPRNEVASDKADSTGSIRVQDEALTEISGLAASRRYPGCFWAHNDSGDTARLFLLGPGGATVATLELEGIEARDWEDMALAGDYLYIGDIGDNFAVMENVRIHRLREPELDVSRTGQRLTIGGARIESMTLRYPDGPRDAETLAVTPTGRLLIVTKNREKSGFYVSGEPFLPGGAGVLRKIGEHQFGFTGWATKLTTGGDFSPDGHTLAVQTYSQIALFALGAAFDTSTLQLESPQLLALPPLRQSESVCFSADGEFLWCSSEGKNPPLVSLRTPRSGLRQQNPAP